MPGWRLRAALVLHPGGVRVARPLWVRGSVQLDGREPRAQRARAEHVIAARRWLPEVARGLVGLEDFEGVGVVDGAALFREETVDQIRADTGGSSRPELGPGRS